MGTNGSGEAAHELKIAPELFRRLRDGKLTALLCGDELNPAIVPEMRLRMVEFNRGATGETEDVFVLDVQRRDDAGWIPPGMIVLSIKLANVLQISVPVGIQWLMQTWPQKGGAQFVSHDSGDLSLGQIAGLVAYYDSLYRFQQTKVLAERSRNLVQPAGVMPAAPVGGRH